MMTSVDWDAFENNKLCVRCDTKEKANAFLKECEEEDYLWINTKSKPTQMTNWEVYESNTVYVGYPDKTIAYGNYNNSVNLYPQFIDYELGNIATINKREFETGAVRDKKDGKGRFDLMPLSVVSSILNYDEIISYIDNFLESHHTAYLYLAIKSFIEKSKAFTDRESMLLEVAVHFEDGAKKYGEYNWQKGIPINSYIDSAMRHYIKWRRGDEDERHDRAFVWNLMCCIWEVDCHESKNRRIEVDKETGETT